MRLDGITIWQGDSASLGLTTFSTDLTFTFLVVAFDFVGSKLTEGRGEIRRRRPERFETRREKFAAKVVVGNSKPMDVPEEAK